MKKLVAVFLSLILIFTAVPLSASATLYSGDFGNNLTWSFNTNTGILQISGSGQMPDYSKAQDVPWIGYRNNITDIVIDDTITHIGDYSFYGMTSLTKISFPLLIDSIGDYSFYGCEVLVNLTIPNTVTTIGDYAFGLCNKLKNVTFGNHVKNIGNNAFYYCRQLLNINLPSSVETIGDYAFTMCDAATSIVFREGLKSIGANAFKGCTSVTNITIPSTVQSIGEDAFLECNMILAIDVASANANYCSVDGILFNKNKTELIKYPPRASRTSYTVPSTVTKIHNHAFYYCVLLTELNLSAARDFGKRSVYRATALKKVIMPTTANSIGEGMFYGCSNLTDINIPTGISAITKNMFYLCASLEEITIPNGITTISNSAFCMNTALKSITLPTSVTTIESQAFKQCSNLKYVTIPAQTTNLEAGIFTSSPNVVVRCFENSAAHKYCEKYAIEYVLLGDVFNVDLSVKFVGAEGKETAKAVFTDKNNNPLSFNTSYVASQRGGTFDCALVYGEEYNIIITKPGHTTYSIHSYIAGINNIDNAEAILYAGDVNGDNVINAKDHAAMTSCFGAKIGSANYTANADFNEDGYINAKDRALVVANFSKSSGSITLS